MISPIPKNKIDGNQFKISYKPLKGSTKIYKSGQLHKDLKVPFREIQLSPTINSENKEIPNDPVILYDTSGPYTDTGVHIDISKGLDELRAPWIKQRGDVDIGVG